MFATATLAATIVERTYLGLPVTPCTVFLLQLLEVVHRVVHEVGKLALHLTELFIQLLDVLVRLEASNLEIRFI